MKIALIGSALNGISNFFIAQGYDTIEHNDDELVQKIHDEFDVSFEIQNEQVKQMLEGLQIPVQGDNIDKARRLSKLGFKIAAPVEKATKIQNEITETNNKRKIVEEKLKAFSNLQANYPFSKFITFEELKRICKKYNLVYTGVERYLNDVPEKNIKEIEIRQKLNSCDLAQDDCYIKGTSFWSHIDKDGKIAAKAKFHKLENCDPKDIQFMIEYKSTAKLAKYNFPDHEAINSFEIKKVNKQGLFICAPASHFDLKGLDFDGEFGYAKHTIVEVKDPVVFEFVGDGNVCRIITKWGKSGTEADDPILNNPINN